MKTATKKKRAPVRREAVPAEEATERLIKAASELFYEEGVRAIGIDALVARAGVNKMSLYRHFASKDDVVVAYLERRNALYWANFDKSVAKHPDAPASQLVQLCTDLVQRASATGYRGCPFVNVASEIADAAHPARVVATRHKSELLTRLLGIARETGARDPDALAHSIALLMEGAYTATQTFGGTSATLRALPAAAQAIVNAALA